jgi:FAD binding domain-containing protein/berberine-like enzyme
MPSKSNALIENLRASIGGRVIVPGDPDYDEARALFSGVFDPKPAAIARVADAADVAQVVRFVRDAGVELAVRSGGHSGAGHSGTDGGIVLDLRDMKGLDIDAEQRTAWAQTGLTAAEYTTAVGAHGLATGFGDTGSVGIGGITLGGGVGYLVRKHGMTIDALLAAEVVTADGEILQVDAEHHEDLFWAIRGGGGNFGVATRFLFRLHPVAEIVGGMMMLPATPDVIAGFITLAEEAPEELSTIANVMSVPPMPMFPEAFHGRLVVMALMCYAGSADDGQRALAPFRALAEPMLDMVQPMPYPQIYPPEDDTYHPTAVGRNMFIDTVDDAVAMTILKYIEESDASMRVAQLRVLGGAMARVPSDATAFAHRSSRIMVNVAAFYDGAEDKVARDAWVESFAGALRQQDDGAYVNFVGEEGGDWIRRAYPGPTWDRLVEVKERYDPTNLFRLNQNVPPGAARNE